MTELEPVPVGHKAASDPAIMVAGESRPIPEVYGDPAPMSVTG